MASVPKPTALTSTAPASNAWAVAAQSHVASTPGSQVEALNAGTNISFDAAASGFQQNNDNTQLTRDGNGQQKRADPGFNRLFTSNSQVFASIFQDEPIKTASRGQDNQPTRSLGRTVSSVIKTYEKNALVISGQQPVSGTTFSFSL